MDEIYLWHRSATGISFKIRSDRMLAIRGGETLATKTYAQDLMEMPMKEIIKLMLAFEAELMAGVK